MSEAMSEENGQEHVPMQVMKAVPRITVDVFCDVPQTAQVIQRASEDRRLAKAHVSVHPGGIVAAVTHFREAATPNLIVVESVVMLLVFAVIVVNFAVDLAYAAVDPRLRART